MTALDTPVRRTTAMSSRYSTFMSRHSSLVPTFAAREGLSVDELRAIEQRKILELNGGTRQDEHSV